MSSEGVLSLRKAERKDEKSYAFFPHEWLPLLRLTIASCRSLNHPFTHRLIRASQRSTATHPMQVQNLLRYACKADLLAESQIGTSILIGGTDVRNGQPFPMPQEPRYPEVPIAPSSQNQKSLFFGFYPER